MMILTDKYRWETSNSILKLNFKHITILNFFERFQQNNERRWVLKTYTV